MKVLFVCKSNVGRSQIAEAFFNKFSKNYKAISAGVDANVHAGRQIKELSQKTPQCMLKEKIDISKKFSKQLTSELINQSDLVVWIAPEEKIPKYLDKHKLVLWKIKDAGGTSYQNHCEVRDKLKKLVLGLVKELDNS
ncbi:low molecular weight phosphatase family protein [Candidatus Pacearchaeota archaeon]|nr:low molecular weight phosphatase family protein [Candidatus Pacearchaeota archaeon]